MLAALHEQNGAALLEIADNMAARSVAFDAALQELATLLHRIALAQTLPQAIPDDEPDRARLMELARAFTAEEVQLYYQIAIHGRDEIDLAPDEYAGFSMTMLRMLAFAPARNAEARHRAKPVAEVGHGPRFGCQGEWIASCSQTFADCLECSAAKRLPAILTGTCC